ncbi:hypothetical protein GCM10010246_16390 [Streptomyces cuspidosporus]|uniref:Uncharacterized protein n=1 Tax=Streptomyces cuspidosporus TaxID=66882 RepID=A0ABP5SNM9_9ACTN
MARSSGVLSRAGVHFSCAIRLLRGMVRLSPGHVDCSGDRLLPAVAAKASPIALGWPSLVVPDDGEVWLGLLVLVARRCPGDAGDPDPHRECAEQRWHEDVEDDLKQVHGVLPRLGAYWTAVTHRS